MGASRPERWLPGTTAVGPHSSGQSLSMMWAPIANTGYGMRSSHSTSSGRGTCGPASQCHGPPPNSGGLRQRRVGDHVAVAPSSGSMAARIAGCPTAACEHGPWLSIW